jgi:hypothetical protein
MAGPPLTVARLRRALKRSPRYLAWRACESVRWRARRPWSRIYPRLTTERRVLSALGASDVDTLWNELAAAPFFVVSSQRSESARRFTELYPQHRAAIVAAADAITRHEFDLLGSGPTALGSTLPWLTDFKTGREWPLEYCTDIDYNELDRPTDVKVPWELSRCQHFTRLGQAYWLTGDDRYASEFVAEISHWLSANPFSLGVNWACAMDVALRAVSWIWGFHFFADAAACRDRTFRSQFVRGLFLHGEFIVKHLEKADLNGNHYLCDGVGLVFLGCFFKRARAATRWRALGRSIVENEIFTQTTEDGVDFEMSIAYHRLVLEGFLTSYLLLRQHGEEAPAACWSRLERMCEFVAAYTKPNGLAPLIGDADDGRIQILGQQDRNDHRYLLSTAAVVFDRADFKATAARCWDETFWMLGPDKCARFAQLPDHAPPPQSSAFARGGFYVLRSPSAHVVVDCGEVGFGKRGGHGHNDILSFELFMNGFNVVTDCGAYLYTASREWRNRFRSTAFHNTVQVDGEELNRFLTPDSLWQLCYDAVPIEPRLEPGRNADTFSGGHRGYERLVPPVTHTRQIVVDRCAARVLVCDRISGTGTHEVVSRFHLDPAVRAAVEGYDVRLSCGDREVWMLADQQQISAPVLPVLEVGWVSPSYGVKVPATVVVWRGSISPPFELLFIFAERRLSREERGAAAAALTAAPVR